MPSLTKLHWQCRRGTKELDLLLQHYLQTGYLQATTEEQAIFVELLDFEDDQLSTYLLGEEQYPSSNQLALVINKIRNPITT